MIATPEPPIVAAAMRRLDRFRQADIERLAEWIELASLGKDESREERKHVGTIPYGMLPGEEETAGWIMFLRCLGWDTGDLFGFEQIAGILNHKNIRTRCGGIWFRATIRAIIRRICPVLAVPKHRLKKLSDERLAMYWDDVAEAAKVYRQF